MLKLNSKYITKIGIIDHLDSYFLYFSRPQISPQRADAEYPSFLIADS